MNGHFEVGNSSYPIGYLNFGGDAYRVCDMRTLEPLNNTGLPMAVAARIAAEANNLNRTSVLIGITQIATYVAEQVAAHTRGD